MNAVIRIVYSLKKRAPFFYKAIDFFKQRYVLFCYSRKIKNVLKVANLKGHVAGVAAGVRPISISDLSALEKMFELVDPERQKFFKPHPTDRKSLAAILKRRDVMTYALFVDNELKAYCLLKLFPCKKAYRGRLVSPDMKGKGLGKFLSDYLNWQCCLLGFQPYATIHESNLASLKSHSKDKPFEVIDQLSDGYLLVRFLLDESDRTAPILNL